MSLTFQDMQQRLQEAVDRSSGALRVDAATLGSVSITSLLNDFFDGALNVVPPQPQQPLLATGNITVDGKTVDAAIVSGTLASQFLSLSKLPLQAQFYLLADVAHIRLTLTLPDPWKLSSSFSSLLNSDVDRAELHRCVFQVDSLRPEPDPLGADFAALFAPAGAVPRQPATRTGARSGLTLTAQLRLASVEEMLTDFIPMPADLLLQGQVEVTVDTPRPRMRLFSATDLYSFTFNDLTLKLGYQFATAPVSGDGGSVTQQIRQRLTTSLAYPQDRATFNVPLGITFAPNSLSDSVTIALDTDRATLSLPTLTGLLPGDIGKPLVVPELKFPSIAPEWPLELKALRFELSGNPLAFRAVQARVQVPVKWTIVEDLVVFESLALDFTVTRENVSQIVDRGNGDYEVTYKNEWCVRPYVLGTFEVAGGHLTGVFDLTSKSYFGMLDQGKVDLKKLFETTLGQPGLLPAHDAFDLTTFEIQGDPIAHRYTLDIGTTLDIPIHLGDAKIKGLFFSLEKDTNTFSGRLGGSIEIAGVTAAIAASYDNDAWSFATALYNVKLTDLLTEILGDPALASKLPDVTLAIIEFSVTPGTKAFRFYADVEIEWTKPFGVDGTFKCAIKLLLERRAAAGNAGTPPPVTYDIQVDGQGSLQINATSLAATLKVHATNQGENHGETKFTAEGTLAIDLKEHGTFSFGLKFDTDDQSRRITARWPAAANPANLTLDFKALATHFGMDMTQVPDALVPTLTGVTFDYDFTTSQLVLAATTTVTKLVFLTSPRSGSRFYAFLLAVTADVRLSNLPLIGADLPSFADIGVTGVLVAITSMALEAKEVQVFNKLIADADSSLPTLPLPPVAGQQLPEGAVIAVNVFTEGATHPLMFSINGGADRKQNVPVNPGGHTPGALTSVGAARSNDMPGEAWLDVQRSFGPVNIQRIGASYANGDIVLLLDAALVLSGMSLEMQGWSLQFPTKDFDLSKIHGDLRGMALTYQSDTIEISGGFLSIPQPAGASLKYEYNGELLIQTRGFGLAAIGSFAQFSEAQGGEKSLFLFGVLNATLGGPAFFVVTGIAAGFGYNRSLTLPTVDNLHKFPLIAAATGTNRALADAQQNQNPAAALKTMSEVTYPAVGQNWVAAGIKFTSFKILDSFALLTVSFGNRFEIALLGLSSLTMPPLAPPETAVGFAQLALVVSFAPDDGVLKAAAQLTAESYILSHNCHLTGGFALSTWFKDELQKDKDGKVVYAGGLPRLAPKGFRAGDFVLSLGGYHPHFAKPAHYPSVPRIGANWQVSDNLTIKGGLYFALTPSAVMAGGALDATFACGRFKAWFQASIDFLLYWEPFHYEAEARLSLGASYTLGSGASAWTITVHVGVVVTLQGPPFGGIAVVDLYLFTVTIPFGESHPRPGPLTWAAFKQHYLEEDAHKPVLRSGNRALPGRLPDVNSEVSAQEVLGMPTDTICFSRVSGGLIKELPAGSGVDWIVNAEKFEIVTDSKVPCSIAALRQRVGTNPDTIQPLGSGKLSSQFGITPCGFDNGDLSSTHTIAWETKAGGGPVTWAGPNGDLPATTRQLPRAAWYKDARTDITQAPRIAKLNADPALTDRLTTGFTLRPTVPPAETTLSLAVDTLGVDLASVDLVAKEQSAPERYRTWAVPTFPTTDPWPGAADPVGRMQALGQVSAVTKRDRIAAALGRQQLGIAASTETRHLAAAARQNELLAAPILCHLGEPKR